MTWNGYEALGNLASGVFTELSNAGYTRQPFTFGGITGGVCAGYGAVTQFATTSPVVTAFNALGFYPTVSGGTPTLVYPLHIPHYHSSGQPYSRNPNDVQLDTNDYETALGMPLDFGASSLVTGLSTTLSATNNITAGAGGTQGVAFLLPTTLNRVVTVVTTGDSVKLPPSAPGLQITIANAHASNAVNVFPSTGDQINIQAVNTSFSLVAQKTVMFFCVVVGIWNSNLSA